MKQFGHRFALYLAEEWTAMKRRGVQNALDSLILSRLRMLKKEEKQLGDLLVSRTDTNDFKLRERFAKWCADVDRLDRMIQAY
ncbi:MAG TPA: hypothetical protein VF283_13215 [Bryobacteraceae bacterium]